MTNSVRIQSYCSACTSSIVGFWHLDVIWEKVHNKGSLVSVLIYERKMWRGHTSAVCATYLPVRIVVDLHVISNTSVSQFKQQASTLIPTASILVGSRTVC